MIMKILLLLILVSVLVWSVIKLIALTKREKTFRKAYQEPILNTESNFDDVVVIRKITKQEPKLEDSDSILGLRSSKILPKKPEIQRRTKQESSAIIIHMMAPQGKPFVGYELLQSLLAAGLRYGEDHFFHRHEQRSGKGPILFNLASAKAPGTFELAKMGDFSCVGLSFFMILDDRLDNVVALETMIDTANQLLENLGGALWDEHYKPLTMDKMTEYRMKVRQYQESLRIPDFFKQTQEV